jgi:hypothetical protein
VLAQSVVTRRAATRCPCSPSLCDQTGDVELGACQRCPTAACPLALTTPALRIGDSLLDRKCGTLGPCRVEVVLAHGIPNCGDPSEIVGFQDLESHHAHALTGGLRRAEQPGRCQVVAGFTRHDGKAVESEWDDEITPDAGRQIDRVVGIAFGRVELTVRDDTYGMCRPNSCAWACVRTRPATRI